MRVTLLIMLVVMALSGLGTLLMLRGEGSRSAPPVPQAAAPPAPSWPDQVAANGVVEGARPEAALRLEVVGRLTTIQARENQDVPRGALLAELNNEAQKYEVALAAAKVATARAELDRLRNGERPEKRKALAAVEQAKHAVYQQVKSDWERSQRLSESRSVSREQVDRDYYTMLRARAEWEEAAAERAQVEAPARADEVAAAAGRVAAAEASLKLAQAELDKTRLIAPGAGRVLQVYAEPGEMAGPATPQPVLTMADLSRRRVRAFVEELDAGRVQVGQPAEVTADGFPDQKFPGKVAVVSPRMGKRAPQTDTPGEYKDVYFREALIDLDAGDQLPLNLRVQVQISTHPRENSR